MDARLTDLEVRYTYLERTVGDLSELVIELRAEVERLQRELTALRALVWEGGPGPTPPNEKPPHF